MQSVSEIGIWENCDNYFSFEDDEEKKQFIIDSYQNEREMKLQLEIFINQWRKKGVVNEIQWRPFGVCGIRYEL